MGGKKYIKIILPLFIRKDKICEMKKKMILPAAGLCTTQTYDPATKTWVLDTSGAMTLNCLEDILYGVLYKALFFLGAIGLLMLIYGAIKFIISKGDPKGIQSAQKTMTYAIFGIGTVILTFLVINLVTGALGLPNILTNFSFYQP